ncbi:MAG: ABC transporter ATP-binding protein [bacterium]|nr:ABC transporter ATP-binding protein [bacterium]
MGSPDRGGIVLETHGLGFGYGSRRVLEDVTLDARPGEIVGLLGPNGSGKSTLIRVLSGILDGYEGSATVDGREVSGCSRRELARLLAVVPQEPAFSFAFTAIEIVLLGRHPHLAGLEFESDADRDLAMEALERCSATHLAQRPIHELSSGERQRIVFAKALVQQPRALLLDEPASFLDIKNQVELYDVVRDLAERERCTVLTVLHDLNLAAEYCDRIFLLREGRIEAGGPTEEVFTYANLTRVFGTEVYVDTNALTGKMLVTPLPGRTRGRIDS